MYSFQLFQYVLYLGVDESLDWADEFITQAKSGINNLLKKCSSMFIQPIATPFRHQMPNISQTGVNGQWTIIHTYKFFRLLLYIFNFSN